MMCIVIIAQYADCTPCGFGSRQKVRSVVHPRAAILHFDGLHRRFHSFFLGLRPGRGGIGGGFTKAHRTSTEVSQLLTSVLSLV